MEKARRPLPIVSLIAATLGLLALLLAWTPWQAGEVRLSLDEEVAPAVAPHALVTRGADEPGPALRTTAPVDRPAQEKTLRRSGNRVRVRVTAHDKPVANRGIRMYGTALRPVRALFLDAQTGADGTCTLDLPPGSFQIGLIPSPLPPRPNYDHLPAHIRSTRPDEKMRMDYGRALELEADRGTADVVFEIPGCSLEVRVLDAADNRPIPGVRVSLDPASGFGRRNGMGDPFRERLVVEPGPDTLRVTYDLAR